MGDVRYRWLCREIDMDHYAASNPLNKEVVREAGAGWLTSTTRQFCGLFRHWVWFAAADHPDCTYG